MLDVLGGSGDASGKGLKEVGGVCHGEGNCRRQLKLGRMCSWWRQALHATSSLLSGAMEKPLSSTSPWWTPMHQRENNSM